MRWRRLAKTLDWDAVGGLVAAIVAVILHLLNVVGQRLLLVAMTSLLALLFFRDLRREVQSDELADSVTRTERTVDEIRSALDPSGLELIGPETLRRESQRFGRAAHGEMVWFNICLLMLTRQETFDALLRPAIENSDVTAIRFILDESQRDRWRNHVRPKIDACENAETVREPLWYDLDETVAFILAPTENDRPDALVSFWGEPFMAETVEDDVTRYVIHAKEHSELVPHLRELERRYRSQPE